MVFSGRAALSHSAVSDPVTPWTEAHQAGILEWVDTSFSI